MDKQTNKLYKYLRIVIFIIILFSFIALDYFLFATSMFCAWAATAPPHSNREYYCFWAKAYLLLFLLIIPFQIWLLVYFTRRWFIKNGTGRGQTRNPTNKTIEDSEQN